LLSLPTSPTRFVAASGLTPSHNQEHILSHVLSLPKDSCEVQRSSESKDAAHLFRMCRPQSTRPDSSTRTLRYGLRPTQHAWIWCVRHDSISLPRKHPEPRPEPAEG